MYPFITIIITLAFIVLLLRLRVPIGRAMLLAVLALALLLQVSPVALARELAHEYHTSALRHTTGYLFVTLTILIVGVNILGAALHETGLAGRLLPALHALFRSRRLALALIPLLMGLLPTPGGIMLSAPMVRQACHDLKLDNPRSAAINYYFRHLWEFFWPLYPAVPLLQVTLQVAPVTILAWNAILFGVSLLAGAACLLLPAFPPSGHTKPPARNLAPNLLTVARVLWPVAIAATLYAVFNLSPAWPICAATPILLLLHRVPRPKWKAVFLAGFELENVLIILGAMLFKTILQAGEAAPQIVAFFTDVHVPPILLIFLVPFIVAVTTGLTFASFAITLPVLLPFLQGPHGIHMGREVLFVASVISGLLLTPIHLCLALSVTYFQASWFAIVARFLPGVLAMLATGLLLTLLC